MLLDTQVLSCTVLALDAMYLHTSFTVRIYTSHLGTRMLPVNFTTYVHYLS